MCNIAGYIGTKTAAPILTQMMLRQEGYNAGFYTGIATIHEGVLHHAKKTGNTWHLLETTNAASLPGTVGLIHGRTNDGGGDEWAHPFIGKRDGVPTLAYVANGGAGYFAPRMAEYMPTVLELLEQGYEMFRLPHTEKKAYTVLPDGTHIHMSDAMCQFIQRGMDGGKRTDEAMEQGFCQMPSEVVALALNREAPECIFWARINKPMYVAFADHGAYLASTPAAFPEDIRTEPLLLGANTRGRVWRDRFETTPFREPPVRVEPMDALTRKVACMMVQRRLELMPTGFSELWKMVKLLYPERTVSQDTAIVYEILEALKQEGTLKIEVTEPPAARPDLKAYLYRFSL